MSDIQTLEIPIQGMDCTECTLHVQRAIAALPGVEGVDVFLTSSKAIVRLDSDQVDLSAINRAVESAGYRVAKLSESAVGDETTYKHFARRIFALLGTAFGVVLFVVVVGEWLGLFETVTARLPWFVGMMIVLAGGYPVFLKVIRAALRLQIIAHTLMSLGVMAALAVGEWATAAVIVFFMRVGDYVESFTTEQARRAVKDLAKLAPATARVEGEGGEKEMPLELVRPGDTVVVRPGEMIPVDGYVISGQATVNQATITGEAMPVEAGPGAQVFAATLVNLGSLRICATRIGSESSYGRVIKLVEEAEAHRGDVQRLADRFSAVYLPLVAGVAVLTYLLRQDPLATAAVLVVACSCAFALATPIAMLASIGAGARRGLMIKGGKYLEMLDKADVLLIDKTGTLTLGKPVVTDMVAMMDTISDNSLLRLAASAERYSEHPLAQAVRLAALERGLNLLPVEDFKAAPGRGVRAWVNGWQVEIGNQRLTNRRHLAEDLELQSRFATLEAQGKTLIWVTINDQLAGVLAVADTLRPEIPQAIAAVRRLGIKHIELLTGDNPRAAAALAGEIGISYRAELLPEDKIRIVREYQSRGHRVIMVGDGVNDAPALAQADVGIAMGAAGTDIAVEAAHIALMREDWTLVPQVMRIARRTMRVVKGNIAFTAMYNLVGLSLAALGYLPPIFAAAAQSLPDLGILLNSSRLLKQRD